MKIRWILTFLAVVFIILTFFLAKKLSKKDANRTYAIIQDFELQNLEGPWMFSKNIKKFNVFYFGFTYCPDVCPVSLNIFKKAGRTISEELKSRTNFIFISLDSKRDTTQVISKYIKNFDSNIIGLSTTLQQADEISKKFMFAYSQSEQPNSALKYTIIHPNRIYIVDDQYRLVHTISNPSSESELVDFINKF